MAPANRKAATMMIRYHSMSLAPRMSAREPTKKLNTRLAPFREFSATLLRQYYNLWESPNLKKWGERVFSNCLHKDSASENLGATIKDRGLAFGERPPRGARGKS